MTYVQAFILAIIEGITEFLPISSTAHMKFANPFLGVADTPFTNMFEVVIQLAAILSVVVIYWKKFLDVKHFNFYIKLIIAVIPVLVVGGLFKKHIDAALSNLAFIASVMIAGGIDSIEPPLTVRDIRFYYDVFMRAAEPAAPLIISYDWRLPYHLTKP